MLLPPITIVVMLAQGRNHGAIDPAATALLVKMRAAYSSIRTAHAEATFVQYGNGKSVTLKTDCTYQAPWSFRVASKGLSRLGKSGYVVTSDGKLIHVEGLPSKPFTVRFNERNMWRSLPQLNLEVLCLWDWKQQFMTDRGGNMANSTFFLRTEQWNGKTYTVLQENAQQVRVLYYIDPATSLIWRTENYAVNGKKPISVCTIEKLEINQPVNPKLFKVVGTPPPMDNGRRPPDRRPPGQAPVRGR